MFGHTFDFGTVDSQPWEQLWPPEVFTEYGAAPPTELTITCKDCVLAGKIEQEFHLELSGAIFEDDDASSMHDKLNMLVKRAYFSWTMTEEIVIRNQVEIEALAAMDVFINISLVLDSPPSVTLGLTAGGVYWEPRTYNSEPFLPFVQCLSKIRSRVREL